VTLVLIAALRDERQSLSGLQWAVDELKLGRARESLDTGLLAKRGGAISDRNDGCQVDRGAAPRSAEGPQMRAFLVAGAGFEPATFGL
jgi:hypothetical protein